MKKTISQRFFLSLCLMIVGCLWGSAAWAEELAINFESTATSYTNWTFSNMTSKQTGKITAHGGTYYGTTGGNGTASITTKNAIPYPSAITFYISKESDNTNSSSWKIQVSSNGSSWTDVKTQSATSMSKGSWVEVTQDLSKYNNVYIRVYYKGSTAVREIDDLSLTYTTTAPPKLNVSKSEIEFGEVETNDTDTQDFTISGTNLTADATLEITGTDAAMFSVNQTTINATDGNIAAKNVTVTYAPTATGDHSATLTISSGTLSKAVSLSGTGIEPLPHYTVSWMVNGETYTAGTPSTDVAEGKKVETLPTNPAAIGSNVFMGWTTSTISGTSDDEPAVLFTTAEGAPAVTGNTTYYAVFAKLLSSTSSWNRVKTLAEITNGSYVIKSSIYVLPSTKATSSQPKVTAAPTITGDVITGTVEESMTWYFTSTGTANQFYVKNSGGDYLYAFNDSKGIRVSSTSDKWTFSDNTTGYFSMQEANNSRYCGVYKNQDWRSYESPTYTNYANGGRLELYKLVIEETYNNYATTIATQPASNIHATTYYKKITSSDELVDGGVYLIVCESRDEAMGVIDDKRCLGAAITLNGNTYTGSVNQSSYPYEVTITKDKSGYYNLYHAGGKYITSTSTDFAFAAKGDNGWSISFDGGNAIISNKNTAENYIQRYNSNNYYKNYQSGQTPIQLYQKVGEMPIAKATGYVSTYVADFAYVMPKHITGHTVALADKQDIIVTEKAFRAGDEVPALTPLLIKSDEDYAAEENSRNYNPAVLNKTVDAYKGANMLEYRRTAENYTNTMKDENVYYYKLAIKDGNVGFYWGATGGAAFEMTKPSTAYLTVPVTTKVQGFVLNLEEGETTGIATVVTNEDAPIYNLQGIRMNGKNLPKGIYIQGGKKFMVK